jgi:hypothetical protein
MSTLYNGWWWCPPPPQVGPFNFMSSLRPVLSALLQSVSIRAAAAVTQNRRGKNRSQATVDRPPFMISGRGQGKVGAGGGYFRQCNPITSPQELDESYMQIYPPPQKKNHFCFCFFIILIIDHGTEVGNTMSMSKKGIYCNRNLYCSAMGKGHLCLSVVWH